MAVSYRSGQSRVRPGLYQRQSNPGAAAAKIAAMSSNYATAAFVLLDTGALTYLPGELALDTNGVISSAYEEFQLNAEGVLLSNF